MEGYVYILKSEKTGRYYIGSSEDPERRLNEFHNAGRVKATKYQMPWVLVFSQSYGDISKAMMVEYKLKRLKSRIILEKIISSGKCTIVVDFKE